MPTDNRVRFFLGSNSSQGFYSLYDHLIDPKQAKSIYILKGGPGCGKSTLMRRIGTQAEEMGEHVEYIQCSGDPESLDGIVLHKAKTAIVDGTAPHVIEPSYPGVVDNYVNLGDCYNKDSLTSVKSQIINCMAGYKDCYKRAYHCLGAAEKIAEDIRFFLITQSLEETVFNRANEILKRELRDSGHGTGQIIPRFLGAVTHQGQLTYYTTAFALCKRFYVIEDSFGLSYLMLNHILAGLTQSGYDVIACYSPMSPDRLEHLIIPELSLSFLSCPPERPCHKRPYRKIRMDAMIDSDLIDQSKNRLRFSRKISAALIEDAVDCLTQAKTMHDELEALYNPHVNFAQVYHIADELSKTILNH